MDYEYVNDDKTIRWFKKVTEPKPLPKAKEAPIKLPTSKSEKVEKEDISQRLDKLEQKIDDIREEIRDEFARLFRALQAI